MKKLFALSAAALLALGLASCGETKDPTAGGNEKTEQPTGGNNNTTTGKTIELVYSGTGSDKVFNESLFEDFKAEMKAQGDPNTYVISYVNHGPDAVDSEIIDWSDKSSPDVYEFASDKLSGLYQKGALARIVGKNQTFIDEELTDFAKACATFNEAYYAYPYTGDNTYYLQYDKSVITNPADAADMIKLMDAAHAQGKKVAYNLSSGFWGAAAMFTFGADYNITFTEDGTISSITADFNGPKGKKAAKAILEIVNHPAFLDDSGVPTSGSDVCAVIGGTWNILTYDKDKDLYGGYKTIWGDNYACAVMPTVTVDGETAHLGAFLGGKLLGVNPQRSNGDSARLQAAHKLAKFLAGKESQLKRFEANNIAPCHVEAVEDPKVKADPNVAVLAAQAVFAHEQTSVPGGVWSAPGVMVTAMKDGDCTAENLQTYLDAYNKTVIGQ